MCPAISFPIILPRSLPNSFPSYKMAFFPIGPFIPVPPADTAARARIAREIVSIDNNVARMMDLGSYFSAAKSRRENQFQVSVRDIVSDLRIAQNELVAAQNTISAVMYHTHLASAHRVFASAAWRAECLSSDVEAYNAVEREERPDFLEPLATPPSSPTRVASRHAFVLNAGL